MFRNIEIRSTGMATVLGPGGDDAGLSDLSGMKGCEEEGVIDDDGVEEEIDDDGGMVAAVMT